MNATANDIRTAYTRERAQHPDLPALHSLRAARYAVRMAGVNLPGYAGDNVRIDLPRGEYIVLRLEDDPDADIFDRLQCESERASEAPADASLGWMDRDGRILCDADPHGYHVAYAWWTDGYGFAQFWDDGRRTHSRHAAWLRARRLVRQSFDYFRDVCEAGYIGYVVTLYDADGEEVSEESCWGFEAEGDYCAQEGYAVAESMTTDRAAHWEREVAAARDRALMLRTLAHNAIGDMRKARGADLPHACEALRGYLANLRRQHSEAVAVIAEGAA